MENVKQTAVQFLIEHIKIDAMYEAKTIDEWVLVFDRAKQMEKEQIKDAFTDGCIGELYELNAYYTSEKYYNETYGNHEKN
jgi:hypothetical protein